MATNESVTRMSADDTDVQRAWAKQFQSIDRAAAALEKLGRAGDEGGQKSTDAWLQLPTALNQGIELAKKLAEMFDRVADAQIKFREEQAGAAVEEDTAMRRIARAAGVSTGTPQFEQMRTQLRALAREYGDFNKVVETGRELLRLGVPAQGIAGRGGILEQILKSPGARGMAPDESMQLARSVMEVLRTQGREPAPENVNEVLRVLSSAKLTREGREGVAELFGKFGELDATLQDLVATYSVIEKQQGPEKAMLAMRGIMSAAMKAKTESVKFFGSGIGLLPSEVDISQVGLLGFAKNLLNAYQRAPDKASFLHAVESEFPRQSFAGLLALQGRDKDIAAAKSRAADREAFERKSNEDRESLQAQKQRAVEETRQVTAKIDAAKTVTLEERFKASLLEKGVDQARVKAVMKIYEENVQTGQTREQAMMDAASLIQRRPSSVATSLIPWSENSAIFLMQQREQILQAGLESMRRQAEDQVTAEETRHRTLFPRSLGPYSQAPQFLRDMFPTRIDVKLKVGQTEHEAEGHPIRAFNSSQNAQRVIRRGEVQ